MNLISLHQTVSVKIEKSSSPVGSDCSYELIELTVINSLGDTTCINIFSDEKLELEIKNDNI